MEARFNFSGKKVLTVLILFFFSRTLFGQFCDSITPTFNVDLSASPNLSWTSPLTARDGFCCGASNPDNCIEFVITLNADAIAINFAIASGAVPPGAMFYQVDCGPITPVGSPICLTGSGPHHLTFCKPGNNSNTYSITSYSEPIIGPDLTLGAGCTGFIYANYYNEPSMTWTSIAPGNPGDYDSYLDCTSGCDTVNITPSGVLPAFVDYMVCGSDIAGCNPLPYCDTVRVFLSSPFSVSIDPDSTHLCFGDAPIQLDAIVAGGNAPYSYTWNTGDTTASILAGAGNYSVDVMDANGCMIATANSVVTQDALPIAANAGPDQLFCDQAVPNVALNGSVQTASGGIWSGGNGTFTPSNTALNASYTPTPAELSTGSVNLILTSTGNNGCNADQDTMTIFFQGFSELFVLNTADITCFGSNDGQAWVNSLSGPGLQYSWDLGAFSSDSTTNGLTPGIHQVTIQNSLGCDTTIAFVINEPTDLSILLISQANVSCFGQSSGSATVAANGGSPGYSYSWNTVPAQTGSILSGVPAGNYLCTVTDLNGCQEQILVTITQPAQLTVNLAVVPPSCFGYTNGAISSVVAGGVSPYDYLWSTNAVSSNIYDVGSGLYSVVVTDSNGCQTAVAAAVNDPAQLVASVTSDTTICPSASVDLSMNAIGGTGTLDYSWSPGGATTPSITVSPASNQVYSCTVTDNNGCSVTLNTSVALSILNPNDLSASASALSLCAQDSVGLDAVYTGSIPVTLEWVHCPSCPVNTTIWEAPAANTSYVISATDQCGQVIYDTVHVTVHSLPVITVNPNMGGICPGGFIAFSNSTPGSQTWDYVWDFGDGSSSTAVNPVHQYDNTGIYLVSLTVTDNNNCTAVASNVTMVTVNPQAIANFEVSSMEVSTLNPGVSFTNFSQNSTNYIWSFGDGNASNVIHPEHEFEEAGVYQVMLWASNPWGCNDSTFVTIIVKADFDLFVPNTFTPDGDAFNGSFFAKGYGISDKGYTFQIFNRWGQLVFESHDMAVGWDGSSINKLESAQDGTYTWVVYFRDLNNGTHRREGHVNLLR